MTWICENCGREFVRRRQVHSCISYDLDRSLSKNGEKWIPFYLKVLSLAREKLPLFSEHFQKTGIVWRETSVFAEFRSTQKDFFAFFYWDSLRAEADPVKHFQMSTNRVVHQVVVNEGNLDRVLEWIADSYFLTQRK